jgi:hypothetical protein
MRRTPDNPAVRLLPRPLLSWKAQVAGSFPAEATARGPSYRLKIGLALLLKAPPAHIDNF